MLTSGPMGAALWIAAGIAALLVARLVPVRRRARWVPEAVSAVVVAFAAGALATALDFGGYSEPDWRAGVFAFFCATAVIGIIRAVTS